MKSSLSRGLSVIGITLIVVALCFLCPQASIAVDSGIACGAVHSVALSSDGTLWTWGRNEFGQLGDGTLTNKYFPVQLGADTDWAAVEAHYAMTIALKENGTLWTWGENSFGQQADGTTIHRKLPGQVGTDTDWAAVASGNYHFVALKQNGSLWAWGLNNSGQVGDGTFVNKTAPVQVGTDTDWAVISAGSLHTMAIKTDGSLWVWGNGSQGQLGTGSSSNRNVPTRVGANNDWASVASYSYHTAGLKTDGSLWVWGDNDHGQLGDGTVFPSTSPKRVGLDNDWWAASASSSGTFGVKQDGSIWGWGLHYFDKDGDGMPEPDTDTTPVQLTTGDDWAAIASGAYHTLLMKHDGTVWAWGSRAYGQLGDGMLPISVSPTEVSPGDVWSSAGIGSRHTMGIKPDNSLWTWGRNMFGQLGDGTVIDRAWPVQAGTDTGWTDVHGGIHNTAALKADGTIWWCGDMDAGQMDGSVTLVQLGTDNDWWKIAGNRWHYLAIKTNGTLWQWGHVIQPDGTWITVYLPQQVGTDTDWTEVAVGEQYSMALKADGTLWGWGVNYFGQVGDGTTIDQPVPVQAGPDTDWAFVTCGVRQTLAIKTDGSLWTWGGVTGNPQTYHSQVGAETDWANVASGLSFTLALKSDGSRWGMGANSSGQLGDGTTTQRYAMTRLDGDNDWADVHAGYYHGMARKTDGSLWAWGENGWGQVGGGLYSIASRPVNALNLALDHYPPTVWADPAAGFYLEEVTVSLWAYDETDLKPVVRFTMDGSDPTVASPVYGVPLNITVDTTVKFVGADAAGHASSVGEAVYDINHAPQPTATPITAKKNKQGTTQVAHNDPDPGDTHGYDITVLPQSGSAVVDTQGLVTYTPNSQFVGTDALTVEVADQLGATGSVTVDVYIGVDPPPECTDADLDGYAVEGGACGSVDCDDSDPLTNPGETEICGDGADNDCNGHTDSQDVVCGGCPEDPEVTCDDGYDNDCDSLIDVDDPDCAVGSCDYPDREACNNDPNCEWQGNPRNGTCVPISGGQCTDSDADGWGDPGDASCPNGAATDCDDANPAANPGMTEGPEGDGTCLDGFDNDCDGLADILDPSCQPPVDCGQYPDKNTCNSYPACLWDNKNKVCVNQ